MNEEMRIGAGEVKVISVQEKYFCPGRRNYRKEPDPH
jgi:hypothetical protein